jgi:hypothetical protein
MSMTPTIGDHACNELDGPLSVLEGAITSGSITDPPIIAAIRMLRPHLEENALSMKAISQITRIGVSRFPLAPMSREIAELQVYREARRKEAEEAAGVIDIAARRAKKSRSTADSNGAA